MATVMPPDRASQSAGSVLTPPSGRSAGLGDRREGHGLIRKVRVLIR